MNARTRTLHLAFLCVVAALLAVLGDEPAHGATAAAAPGAPRPAADGDAIAQGGGVSLDAAAVREIIQSLPAADRRLAGTDAAVLERVVRGEVVNRALLAEARQAGFEGEADVRAQLGKLQEEALLRLWLARQAKLPEGYPSEADIQAAYEANKATLVAPTQYRLAQVFIALPAEPVALQAALRKAAEVGTRVGGDFAKAARESSEHAASAAKGGDMGYLPEDQLAPEVLAAVRALKAGDVAGPVRTAQGLHYLKLIDRRAGLPLSLAEAREPLAAALRQRKAAELSQAYLAALNARLAVSVNQIELARLQPSLR